MINRWLNTKPFALDAGLLVIRVTAALLLLTHGWSKAQRFPEGMDEFADPIGLGMAASFVLVTFAEFICTIFVAIGLWTRLALIPIIINMAVIALIVHAEDPFQRKELPILFLFVFIALFLTGPGKFSLDQRIYR